ncbi:hypothetical protein EIP86_006487 [Pleurotus ostreatoroseus]|nr:hypothetical protein EIP86_006487 [Pleurotus ostreatoroseus]
MDLSTLYTDELRLLGHGLPIWDPQPTSVGGVQIGDVGLMLDGSFYRLFNAIAPASHRYNQNGVPHGFTPFQYDSALLDTCDSYMLPAVYSGRNITLEQSIDCDDLHRDLGSYTAKLTGNGALLVLADPARREVLLPSEALLDYVHQYRGSWLEYASRLYDMDWGMDDIVFVRGSVKTSRNWAACSWSLGSGETSLAIDVSVSKVDITMHTTHRGVRVNSSCKPAHSKFMGSSQDPEPSDQCIFIVTLDVNSATNTPACTAPSVCARSVDSTKYGIPLWYPDYVYPNRHEVQIGDVGYLNEGAFHRLFNVTVDRQHSWNSHGVPPSFTPYSSPLRCQNTLLKAGAYAGETVRVTPSQDSQASGVNQCYDIFCGGASAHVLFLPKPATFTFIRAEEQFRRYVLKNQSDWFAFASKRTCAIRKPEDLVLVQGFVKAAHWTITSFVSHDADSYISGSLSASSKTSSAWKEKGRRNMSVECRSSVLYRDPRADDDPSDQCVFLSQYNPATPTSLARSDATVPRYTDVILGTPLKLPDMAQHAPETNMIGDTSKMLMEPMRRTSSPMDNVDPGHGSTENIWIKYILETLLYPRKRHTYPAMPDRCTKASSTDSRVIYEAI